MTGQTIAYKPDRSALVFGGLAVLFGVAVGGLVAATASSPLVLVTSVLLLLMTVAAIAKPELGLLALVFLSFTRFSDVLFHFHNFPSVAKWFVALLWLVIVVRWLLYGERPQGTRTIVWLLILYGLVAAFSVLKSQDYVSAIDELEIYAKNAVIAVAVVALLYKHSTLRHVVWVLLVAAMFLATLGVYQALTGTFHIIYGGFAVSSVQHIVGDVGSNRIAGPVGDPNFFAQVLLIPLPLAMDRLWNERNIWLRVVAGYALAVTALAIVFTFSRGGFLAMAFVLVFMLIRLRVRLLSLAIVIPLALVALSLVPAAYTQRMETLLDFVPGQGSNPLEEPAFRGRASEMSAAYYMFRDYPLTGVGLGNASDYYFDYSVKAGLTAHSGERAMHSLYLEIAAELGMLGLLAFGLIVVVMFHGIRRARSDLIAAGMKRSDLFYLVNAIQVAVAGYLFGALFLQSSYSRYLWLLLAIAMAVPNVVKYELAARDKTTG